jgi:hypothetical protein
MAESLTFYFTSVFGLSSGIQTLKLGNRLLLSGVAIGNAVGIITNPLFGALSDPHWAPAAPRRGVSPGSALRPPPSSPRMRRRR